MEARNKCNSAGVFSGTVLFNIFISDLEDVARCVFIVFSDDTKLVMAAGQVNAMVGRVMVHLKYCIQFWARTLTNWSELRGGHPS